MVAFYCYDPSTDGTGGIHRWYLQEITPKIRSEIDGALEVLAREKKLDGHCRFKLLDKGVRCAGLAEIKIDFEMVVDENDNLVGTSKRKRGKKLKGGKRLLEIHVRILGPYNPPNTEFVLLTGFVKTGNWQYGTECVRAIKRRESVVRDATNAKRCRFP